MRFLALATMLALGVMIALPPAQARPPRPPAVKVSNVNISVSFVYNSEVGKVRTIDPPENFDEKGKIKKYTKSELLKLKGDTPAEKKLTGYKSEFSEVKVGDTVQVTISMLKGTPKPKKKEEDPKDDKPAAKAKTGKWVVTNTLMGKVTKITPAATDSDPKMTIQVTTQVIGGGGGGNKTQKFDEEKYAATQIVIGHRAQTNPGK